MRWRLFGSLLLLGIASIPAAAQPLPSPYSRDYRTFRPSPAPCYTNGNPSLPQRCIPDFINAAFNRHVEATNTCGERGPTDFCVQVGSTNGRRVCDTCDSRRPNQAHPPVYLTDFNTAENVTWWQSDTMAAGIQHPMTVNLTLRLGKAFDITYIRLRFVSPRPESFIIYKKARPEDEWKPWQFYSGSCRSTFKVADKQPILPGHEDVAQCTREYSDISPITGGTIAFSTLEGRPSAENFEESEVLQEWVTASAIRIVLVRMNTYGDEIFRDPRVLTSYFYAISDFTVGGRCKCNGHASECVQSTGEGTQQLVCNCKHNTAGVDCDKCEPFFQDRPWRAATSSEANECLPCLCNGLSSRCFFDEQLFNATGHGGHCIDCTGHTEGPHCDKCVANHWRRPREHFCTPCDCHELGSESEQCDESGQCRCKPGVTGERCDRCENGFYDLGPYGCRPCTCDVGGSPHNTPSCNSEGVCLCKANVEGDRCDRCKPGFFGFDPENPSGCSPCFCFAHSSICHSAGGFFHSNISADFSFDTDGWTGGVLGRPEEAMYADLDKAIAVGQLDVQPAYVFAPTKFLGDLRFAYGRRFHFALRTEVGQPFSSPNDVRITGYNNQTLSIRINGQENEDPSTEWKHFSFRLNAPDCWSPKMNHVDFIGVLRNVTQIAIRATYSKGDVGYFTNFTLETASSDRDLDAPPANWVERCECGREYEGQFCERCAKGYKRVFEYGNPIFKCVPCECNGHGDSCNPETGKCYCEDNTAGDTCERCTHGYYGDALNGTPNDCKSCGCHHNAACTLFDGQVVCTCSEGYTGEKCVYCAEDYFGREGGDCRKCQCNGNTDPNSIGNCDSTSGECRRCVYHTTGFNCERCEAGFWGDALSEPKGDCKPCNCYAPGTRRPTADYERLECRQEDGQCDCLPNVIGQFCDRCEAGFFNLTSGSGCEACDCDPLGSLNTTCEVVSGQCACKPGVTGRRCDKCAPLHFGFSAKGCEFCDCDPVGAESDQCDPLTGQCNCNLHVEGLKCDQCEENHYDLDEGCLECDQCYALIGTRRKEIRKQTEYWRSKLDKAVVLSPDEHLVFLAEQKKEADRINDLHQRSLFNTSDTSIAKAREYERQAFNRLAELNARLERIDAEAAEVEGQIAVFDKEKELVNHDYSRTRARLQAEIDQLNKIDLPQSSSLLDAQWEEAERLLQSAKQMNAEIVRLQDGSEWISRRIQDEVQEAIFGDRNASLDVEELGQRANETQSQFIALNELVHEYAEKATGVFEASLLALNAVESIAVNDTSLDQDKKDRLESLDTLKEQQANITAISATIDEVAAELNDTASELEDARAKSELATKEVLELKKTAEAAKKNASREWRKAQRALQRVEDFVSKSEENKVEDELEETLDLMRHVPIFLREVNAKLPALAKQADEKRSEAENIETLASEALQRAQRYKEDSDLLRSNFSSIKTRTVEMDEELKQMQTAFEEHSKTHEEKAERTEAEAKKADEVHLESTRMLAKSKHLSAETDRLIEQMDVAIKQLTDFNETTDEMLDEWERLLNELAEEVDQKNLEYEAEEANKFRDLNADSLKAELEALEAEKTTLQEILDNLPTDCFNVVRLEGN